VPSLWAVELGVRVAVEEGRVVSAEASDQQTELPTLRTGGSFLGDTKLQGSVALRLVGDVCRSQFRGCSERRCGDSARVDDPSSNCGRGPCTGGTICSSRATTGDVVANISVALRMRNGDGIPA